MGGGVGGYVGYIGGWAGIGGSELGKEGRWVIPTRATRASYEADK